MGYIHDISDLCRLRSRLEFSFPNLYLGLKGIDILLVFTSEELDSSVGSLNINLSLMLRFLDWVVPLYYHFLNISLSKISLLTFKDNPKSYLLCYFDMLVVEVN